MAVIMFGPQYIVSSDCVWGKIAAMFQIELWKKIQKLYKGKSIWKR